MRLLLASLLFASACAGHATVVAEPAPPPPAPAPAPAPAPGSADRSSSSNLAGATPGVSARAHRSAPRARAARAAREARREVGRERGDPRDRRRDQRDQASRDRRRQAAQRSPADRRARQPSRSPAPGARSCSTRPPADIDEKEDNNWAKGLRGRANGHIRNAENAVHEAMADRAAGAPPPPPVVVEAPPAQAHPAYLHALTDLRHARFLLEKPAKPEVKWDESNAVHEIDAAINEIKQAAIDDGKPLDGSPAGRREDEASRSPEARPKSCSTRPPPTSTRKKHERLREGPTRSRERSHPQRRARRARSDGRPPSLTLA